jgi:hypothetical protein
MQKIQFKKLFYALISNLQSNEYSFSHYKITLKITSKSQAVNSDLTNVAQIQIQKPTGERTSKTVRLKYKSYHDTIGTLKLNWSIQAELVWIGFLGRNQSKSNSPGFSYVKTHCNGSVLVPILTWNCS